MLSGSHADVLLRSLPPIVHIREEGDKAAMRWSLDRMREELRHPQPGSSLIAQQLAFVMLVQALRLHLAEGTRGGAGWLLALTDRQMSAAITSMHNDPGPPWTLQTLAERVGMSRSVFALRFKEIVGATPIPVGDRFVARLRVGKCVWKGFQESDGLLTAALQQPERAAGGPVTGKEARESPRRSEQGREGRQGLAGAPLPF